MKKVRKQVAALYNEKDNKNTTVNKNEGRKRMVNETETGGSESAMNEPTRQSDHSYSKNEREGGDHTYSQPTITFSDIRDQNMLQKYIDTVCEMELNDLKELNKGKVQSLKDDIGLLWHK